MQAPPLISDQSVTILVTVLVGALSSMTTLIVSLYKERRDRQWKREDEDRSRALSVKMDDTTARLEDAAQLAQGAIANEHPRLSRIEHDVHDLALRVPSSPIRSSDVDAIVSQRRAASSGDRRTEDSQVKVERRRRIDEGLEG